MIGAEAATGTTAPALLKVHRATALSVSAKCLPAAGRFSEALPPLEENLAYYESIGGTQSLMDCLTRLGDIYSRQGLSDKALAVARRVQSLNPNDADTLINPGNLFSNLDLHPEALEYSKKALECEKREHGKNTYHYAAIHERIGTAYLELDELDLGPLVESSSSLGN